MKLTIRLGKLDVSMLLINLFVFVFIFQPPIIPMDLIYIFGAAVIFYVIWIFRGGLPLAIPMKSGMFRFYKFLLIIASYIVVISIIDVVFIDQRELLGNRLRVINQYVVLTMIELVAIWILLIKANKKSWRYEDIEDRMIWGVFQGILSVIAYLFPAARSFFLKFATSSVYTNTWQLQRRAYGYSMILLDVFGYGMGLIAGIILLSNRIPFRKKIIYVTFCAISILLNARTGLVVFMIAVVIYLFKANSWRAAVVKSILSFAVVALGYVYLVPWLYTAMIGSSNMSIRWTGEGLAEVYRLIGAGAGEMSESNMLSDFSHLPENTFELLFGSGHSAYGSYEILKFHSDVGYINLIWEVGIIGTFIVLLGFVYLFYRTFKAVDTKKITILFIAISYFVVLIKGQLIGYNPGTVVTYTVCFSAIYFSNTKEPEL